MWSSLASNAGLLANVHALWDHGVAVPQSTTHARDAVIKRDGLKRGVEFVQIVPDFVDAFFFRSNERTVGIESPLLEEEAYLPVTRGSKRRAAIAIPKVELCARVRSIYSVSNFVIAPTLY